MALKNRDNPVRLIYSTTAALEKFPEFEGKVCAIIGPFETFSDHRDLQRALEMLLRGFNIEPDCG